jgi:L-aminopeptidase/D-esterase-like protein
VATDAPLTSADLIRVARRAGLGLARTGSNAHHGSGEIFLAFSTAPSVAEVEFDPLFTARRGGRVVEALPHDGVLELLRTHGRLER